jgi:hypothetical protein
VARGNATPKLPKARRTDVGRYLIPLAADEDLDNRIVRGVLRHEPDVDIVVVQNAGLSSVCDPNVLEWAAMEGRVLFSHDKNTMTRYAYQRILNGHSMPGLWVVPQNLPLGGLIADVCVIATLSEEGEYEGQVRYLPLR